MSEAATARECWNEVLYFFCDDAVKSLTWFATPNPGLGNVTPLQMLQMGKAQKLLSFIGDQHEEAASRE